MLSEKSSERFLGLEDDDRRRSHPIAAAQRAEAFGAGRLDVEKLRISVERARQVNPHLIQMGRELGLLRENREVGVARA